MMMLDDAVVLRFGKAIHERTYKNEQILNYDSNSTVLCFGVILEPMHDGNPNGGGDSSKTNDERGKQPNPCLRRNSIAKHVAV